jgi:hypothetical protein
MQVYRRSAEARIPVELKCDQDFRSHGAVRGLYFVRMP